MTTSKSKVFDCVEMKQQAQRILMAEYEAHRDEYASYADFIRKTTAQDQEVRRWRETRRPTT